MPSPISEAEINGDIGNMYDNRSKDLIVSSTICIALAIFAVAVRFVARRSSKAKILADDYMIIFALVICMGQVALVPHSVHLRAAKSMDFLDDTPAYVKTITAMQVLYCVGTSAFKYSALLFYHRIFGPITHLTIILLGIAVITFATNFAGIVVSILQCSPDEEAWNSMAKDVGITIIPATYNLSAINAMLNIATVMLPIPFIWKLQMKRSRRIPLVCIFLLSGFVCTASIYRTVVIKRLPDPDATWTNIDPVIWAVVENAIGIVCASLPTMGPTYYLVARGYCCNSVDYRLCLRRSFKSNGSVSSGGTGSSASSTLGSEHEKPKRIYCPSETSSGGKNGSSVTFEMC